MQTDFRGETYDVGDLVFYPKMVGRSVELQEGRVLKFKEYDVDWYETNPHWKQGDPYNERNIKRVVKKWKVYVQPTRSSRFNTTGVDWRGEPQKAVWITNIENVVRA